MKTTEIIAHRGASHDAPENTMAAFNLAWEQGNSAIECDVHLSKDGRIVVIHDGNTKRVSGNDAPVASQTFEELRLLDVGSWKDKVWKGEKIPSLEELFASIPPKKKIYVEIKCGPEIIGEFKSMLNSISTITPEQIVIISFNTEVILTFRKELPLLKTFLLVNFKRDELGRWNIHSNDLIASANDCQAHGLALFACEGLTAALVKIISATGLDLFVWVVDDEVLARRMGDIGIHAMASNRPNLLRKIEGSSY